MKKSLLALALLGAFAGVAQAQTAVQIYGNIDAGITKRTDQTLAIGKRASNTLGFKGTEELGTGLKALFQLEIRYEPDTGMLESNVRPLFQGQSRVGLQGDFGMVRLGRGLTAFQESSGAFEPFHGIPSPVGFQTDLTVGGFTSDPLGFVGNSTNRFSNGFFYNSPEFSGFQVNASVATKESIASTSTARSLTTSAPGDIVGRGTRLNPQYAVGSEASANPFSISGTYKNGPIAAMVAYERNAVETKLMSVAGSIVPMPALKLMASYTTQDQDNINAINPDVKAWVLGANYTMGPGKFLAGYGQKKQDFVPTTKQVSIGYEYSLSKRTYIYVDASQKKTGTTIRTYDVGVNHAF